jgi:hypothetical protein
MARPRKPRDETARGEIYEELLKYSTGKNTLPNAHSFYQNVLKPRGYDIKFSTFRDHWKELILDGLISIDKQTGGTILNDAEVKEKVS